MKYWEILLLVLLPMLLVSGILFLLLKYFFQEEREKREQQYKLQMSKEIGPQRLQAYERVGLFLERIRPTSLATRIEPMTNIKAYELAIIKAIQIEYEHNMAQQIYINPETWSIVFSSKNATQNFIKKCVDNLPEGSKAQDLQEEIIKRSHNESIPSQQAMLYLQKDIQGKF